MIRTLGAGLACLALAAEPAPDPVLSAGQPLGEALTRLEASGLALVFSTELVRPEMRVLHPPRGTHPREVLEEILAPHGLGVRSGPGDRLIVVSVSRAVAPQEGQPTFPAGVELVTVDALVLDDRGAPVGGLGREDFTIFEDGVPQQLARFEAFSAPDAAPRPPSARRPRTSTNDAGDDGSRVFVLVFDEVHLNPLQAERAKETLAAFLRSGLREGDVVAIVPTGGGASWKGRMNAGRRDLVAFLRHLKGLRLVDSSTCAIGEYDAMLLHRRRDPGIEARLTRWLNECNPTLDPPVVQGSVTITPDGRTQRESLREARERRTELQVAPGQGQLRAAAASVYERANVRRRRTLESLARTLDGLAPLRGRKVVLLVSEGFIEEPALSEARDVALASLRGNAAVYFLDARGGNLSAVHSGEAERLPEGRDRTAFLDEQGHLDDGAESIAAETGGETLRGDLADSWQRLAERSGTYYLLGYQPANTRADGRFRKLRIEVARAGATIQARPGYYAPSETLREHPPDRLDSAVRGALDLAAAAGTLPIRVAAFVLTPVQDARARTLLVTETDPRRLGLRESGARLAGQLELMAVVVSRETGALSPVAERLDVSLPADLPGAPWLAIPRELELQPGTYQARVVVRGTDGALGAVEHSFVVPPSGLRISTPILTDTLDPHGRPTPIARSRFAPRGKLHCQFEVYGAVRDPAAGAPRTSARHTLRRSDGSVVSESGFTPLELGSGGFPARVLAISIQDAPPGRYELTLEARDDVSRTALTVQESYHVEAQGTEPRP